MLYQPVQAVQLMLSEPVRKRLMQVYSINFVNLLTLFVIVLLCFSSPLSAETTQLGSKKWERQDLGNDKSLTGTSKFDDQFVGVGDNDSLINLSTESPKEYNFYLKAKPGGGGMVTGGGTYFEDEYITLIAKPNERYFFKNWLFYPQDPLGMPMVFSGVSKDAEFKFIASFFGKVYQDIFIEGIFNKYGDVNFDEVIDVQDVSLVMRHILELEKLDEDQERAADVNYNGKINVQDVTLIMQKALGKIDTFPVSKNTGVNFKRPDRVDFHRDNGTWIYSSDDLPEEVLVWLEDSLAYFTAQTYKYNGMLYLLVAHGQVGSNNREVRITNIVEKNNKLIVTAFFSKVGPGIHPVITYPYDLVVLEDPGLPVEFVATGAETEIPKKE